MTIIDQAKQVLAILLSYAIVLAQLAPLEAQSQNVLPDSATASRTTSSMEGLGGSIFDATAAFHERNSEPSAARTPKPSISLAPSNIEQQGQSEAPAALTVSPASLTFSAQLIDTTSAAKPVTISNTGASAQPIMITMTGDYAETDNCNGSVAAGGSCTAQITFAPTIVGSIKGAATVNDNNNNLLAFVDISGTGQAPVTTAPTSLAFTGGTIGTISAAKTFKITNNTTSSVTINSITTNVPDYTINTGTCLTTPLPSKGKFCTVTVQVTPSSAADDGAIIVTDNAANALPLVVKLTSAATAGSSPISLSKTSLIFKTLSGGTSAAQTITVTNTSASTVTLGTITASADYTILNNTCTASLAAAAKCTFGIEFQPTFVGKIEGTAAVPVNAPNSNSPQVVNLTGTSEAPLTVAPASLTFASQAVDSTSTAKPVKITNNSASAVTLSSVVPSGDFQIQPSGTTCSLTGGTLLAGQICTIEVQFSPTIAGSALGALTVANNASPNPLIISLAGTGAGTGFTLSALPSKFNVTQGSNGASTITVADVGSFTGSVSLTASGLPSGVTAAFNPSSTTGASTLTLTASGSATAGTATVTVTGTSGSLTQTAKINLTVVGGGSPPTITGFTPGSGPEGTVVTVTGTNFTGSGNATPAVTLAHQGGGSIAAPLSSFAATSINFVIPSGAATGDITVTVGTASVTSTTALTVTTPSNFTVGVAPASGTLIQGQSTTFSVTLTSSNGFTGLSALSATGLPTGVTASFTPPSITANQSSILTLSAPANQSTGTSTLTVTASATIAGQQVSQSATASLQVTGVTTSFLGRTVVDDTAQTPLAGVLVMFTGLDDKGNHTGCTGQTTSDASGNFALTNLASNCVGPQLIFYNGMTATAPAGHYAGVDLSYTLTAGQVTTSPVLVHLPRIDNGESVQVQQNASVDQTFTFYTLPGLRVTVYQGTTFTLDDGTQPNPFPLIAVGIPVDRLPDKIATSGMLTTYIVAFQPANAVASQPVAVYFPNPLPADPGTSATLMTLDPARGYMVPYGTGTVSKDGATFIPDPDPAYPGHLYGLVHFDWHGPQASPPNGVNPSPSGCGGSSGGPDPPSCNVGGPVDVSSGIVSYTSTDIRINGGRLPIAINRVYRTLSTNPGPFGLGTSHNFGYILNTFAYIQGQAVITLLMPDGNQFPFSLVSGNTFANTTVPALRGAVLTASGTSGPYVLRWGNGTQYTFQTTNVGIREAFLTSITDPNGNTTTLTLNPSQPLQIQTMTDAVGRSFTLSYDTSNRITQITDPTGRQVSYTYNSQGTLASFTDANGGLTKYTYDSSNNLASITDPRGVITEQNTYNESFDGRITQQIAADGGVYSFAYTLLNPGVPTSPVQQTVVTDPNGNQTTYRFNPQGFLISATDATGQTRTLNRDSGHNNLVTSYQGPGVCPVCGNPATGDVSFTFDQFGNTLTQTDSLGNTTSFTYDLRFNKVATITDALNHITKLTYDSNGNLLTVTDVNGNTTQFAYDSFGDVIQTTDPIGAQTIIDYDSFGDAVQITDALGNVTSLSYDAVSRLVQTVDALGRANASSYDKLDRVTTQTDPKGNTTLFSYDPTGNLHSVKDANGNSTTFTYDQLSHLQARTSPLGKTETYQYDHNGNPIQYTDRRGQVSTYQYDVLNRLVKEAYQDATVIRSYDANGRLSSVNDSAEGVFDFTYDATGRLLAQNGPTGSLQYTRDSLGRAVSRQVVGQSAVQYSYDPIGNLLTASSIGAGATFTYDARNLLQSVTRTNGVVTNYSFDRLGQVLSIVHTNGSTPLNTQNYTYDVVGNRTVVNNDISQPLITQSSTATVDAGNELLTNGTTTYTHDANGNRLTETGPSGTLTYSWDGRNRLASIKDSAGNITSFHYDFNRSLLEIDSTTGGITSQRTFVVDSLLNMVSVTGTSTSPVSILTGTAVDSHFASVDSSGALLFGIGDALGSNVALTTLTGAITTKLYYEPYGQTSGAVSANFPFAFAGRVPVLGNIYYVRDRFYDAAVGRFLSEDPLGFSSGDVNLYAYALDNPISLTDPSGDCPWCIAALIGAATSAAIDLTIQLVNNGGRLGCVNLTELGIAALSGALLSGLSPTGFLLGRGGARAAQYGYSESAGLLNYGATRFGWGFRAADNSNVLRLVINGAKTDLPFTNISPLANPVRDGIVSGALGGAGTGAAGAGQSACGCQ